MNGMRKLNFMMGQVGLMMLTRYFFQWITKFCTETADSLKASTEVIITAPPLDPITRICGVENTEVVHTALFSVGLVGTVLLLFRIFDGVTDPLSGSLSDAWVRRGRERRTLLWYSFWIAPLGLTLCFAPTHAMSEWVKWSCLVGGMFIFFVGYTLYCIPYWSLIADYAGDREADRNVLSALLGAGILIATGIGFVASPLLIEALGYGESAGCFALIAAPLMILPYFAAPPRQDASSGVELQESESLPDSSLSLWSSLTLTFQNRRFVALMFLFAGSQMSLTMMTSAAPFIVEGILNENKSSVPLLMGPFLGMTLLSFPWIPWISRTWGWERSMMWASIGLSVIYLLSGGLGGSWLGSPMTTAMLIFMIAGPLVGVLLGLEGEAITCCAQADDPQRISMYWGVFNLIVKSLNGLAIWVGALVAARICPLRDEFWGDSWIGHQVWVAGDAIRSMSMIAGGFLFIGVIGYLVIRPRSS